MDKFKQYMRDSFGTEPFVRFYDVDYALDYKEDIDTIVKDLGRYEELWGQGLTEPMVVIKNIPVSSRNIFLMSKGTVKITIPNQNTTCIKFGAEDMYEKISNAWPGVDATAYVTLVGTCALNNWNGNINPQIKIVDYEVVPGTWEF